jgi:hypothetical protein
MSSNYNPASNRLPFEVLSHMLPRSSVRINSASNLHPKYLKAVSDHPVNIALV